MPLGVDIRDTALLQRRLWTPQALRADLEIWFDAYGPFDYATGVSKWYDQSGFGNHVTQATGATQPTLMQGAFNGRPALNFSGSQWLATPSMAHTATWSVFVAAIPASVTGNQNMVSRDQAGTARIAQDIRTNGTSLESIAFNSGRSAFTDSVSTPAVAIGTPFLASAVRTSTTVEVLSNGVSDGATGTSGSSSTDTPPIVIGAFNTNAPQQFFNGKISEVIMFTRNLTARERQMVEGYIAWRWWGLNNPLAASHLFKNRPPLIGD